MTSVNPIASPLPPAEQGFLLRLARETIAAAADIGPEPAVDETILAASLREPRGCFVTLHRRGELRGCIGNLHPREPLYRAVMEHARGAAFRDSRFAPVGETEVPELEIEISVLSAPVPLNFSTPEELLRKLRPNVDGVVLRREGRTATFLPQVWQKFPDPARFLNALCEKARLPAAAWRDPETTVLTYQVESFESAGNG